MLSTTPGHVSPPTRSLCALGFIVDCDLGTVAIPAHKVAEMVDLAQTVATRRTSTRHELKQLLGRLCRLIMIIRVGQRFISRILDLIRGPTQPRHAPLQLSVGAQADLSWWLSHASSLNTMTFISPSPVSHTSVFLTDGRGASSEGPPSVGGLCHTARQFFSCVVPPDLHTDPVHVVEAVALLAAARLWVPSLQPGLLVPVGCDNQAVVHACQGGKARDIRLAAMARLLWGVFASSSSTFKVLYVPTAKNTSDGVSRLNKDHVALLLSRGWQQLHPPPVFFSLDEVNPLLYQAVTHSSLLLPRASSSCSRPQQGPRGTGPANAGCLPASAKTSASQACLQNQTPSCSSAPTWHLSGACQSAPLPTTSLGSDRSTSSSAMTSPHPPVTTPCELPLVVRRGSSTGLSSKSCPSPPLSCPGWSRELAGDRPGAASSSHCGSLLPALPASSPPPVGKCSPLISTSPGTT